MINTYYPGQAALELYSDVAAERPLYVYKGPDYLLYSSSVMALLGDERVPVKVSSAGLSFLLQSGVVPPPATIYENLYILGLGDRLRVETQNNGLRLWFFHEFPFLRRKRAVDPAASADKATLFSLLAGAMHERLVAGKPGFLFHSAGKDSNMLACAAAEAGWQDRITLITHRSKGGNDESEISASIAARLGFRHQVLEEVDRLGQKEMAAIENHFINAPFPGIDPVTLAYPLYTLQVEGMADGANIIDGGGNDCYSYILPTQKDRRLLPILNYSSRLKWLRNVTATESRLSPLLKTPAEHYGMSGLSTRDALTIFPAGNAVYKDWRRISEQRSGLDEIEHKTDIHAGMSAAELHIRKVRSFSDAFGLNLVMPFSNASVASYFSRLPEEHLFDRGSGRNKLLLRRILQEHIGLDSDKIGKMGYSYDFASVINLNRPLIQETILACELWESKAVGTLLERFYVVANSRHKYAKMVARCIYRLYLISGWHTHCKYISRC